MKLPVLFEDNAYLFVVTRAQLMHLLLSAKFGNFVSKLFLVVIGNLKSGIHQTSCTTLNILNPKSIRKL